MTSRFLSFEWFPFLNAVIVHARISWSIHLRWLAIVCYFAASLITSYVFKLNIPLKSINILLTILAVINLIYLIIYKRVRKMSFAGEMIFLFIHIMVDLIFLTVILHYSGGIENPVFLFYMFHIVISSIIFPGMVPFLVTSFVTASFSGLIFLEYYGVIPHYHVFDSSVHDNLVSVYVTLTVFITTAFVSTYICTNFMKIYRDVKRKLDEQHRRLIEIDENKTRFFMTTSHELKSPIIAIKSAIDGVVQNFGSQLDERGLNLLKRASVRSGQMLTILKELLDLSRNRMKFVPKEGVQADIVLIIEQLITDEKDQLESRHIDLVREFNDNHIVLDADPEDLKKIFNNLLGNALRYTPDEGQIRIRAEKSGQQVIVTFADNGIGIPENEIDKIFEDFYRAENAKRLVSIGTGLGLSLARQIAQNYGGDLRVDSEAGKGSKFTVNLPVTVKR